METWKDIFEEEKMPLTWKFTGKKWELKVRDFLSMGEGSRGEFRNFQAIKKEIDSHPRWTGTRRPSHVRVDRSYICVCVCARESTYIHIHIYRCSHPRNRSRRRNPRSIVVAVSGGGGDEGRRKRAGFCLGSCAAGDGVVVAVAAGCESIGVK